MPPIERQASASRMVLVIPELQFTARNRADRKHKKAAPVSSSGKKPAQPDRCETMQQVLEYLFEAGRLDVFCHNSSWRSQMNCSICKSTIGIRAGFRAVTASRHYRDVFALNPIRL
jgi:hypothetical protein